MTGKSRVLFVSHSSAMGGAEMCLLNHLRFLDRDRWDPLVVLPGEGVLQDRIEALGVRTVSVPMEWWVPGVRWKSERHLCRLLRGLPENVETIARIIEREEVDLVQTNTVVVVDGALAAARAKRPHVWHVTENLLENETLSSYLSVPAVFALVDLLSDGVAAVSGYLGRRVRGFIGGEKVETIIGGIPVEDFAGAPAERSPTLRRALGCREGTMLVGAVGSLGLRKNPEGFVEVAARLVASGADVMFAWIGNVTEPWAAEAARRQAERLGVSDRVHFVGFQPSTAESLGSLDVLLHPSHNENLSLVCIEAMAAGKPVVATRCGGPEEVVEDGVTGYLVPCGDVAGMAGRLRALWESPDLRKAMGETARQQARERFSAAQAVRRFEDLHRRVLAKGPQPARAPAAELLPSLLDMLRQAGEIRFSEENMRSLDLLRRLLRRVGRVLKQKITRRPIR